MGPRTCRRLTNYRKKYQCQKGNLRTRKASFERFKRLSEGLDDGYMRKFYRKFMESEAGHYTLFINLSEYYIDKKNVRKRWKEWLDYEKDLMKSEELRGDRIH